MKLIIYPAIIILLHSLISCNNITKDDPIKNIAGIYVTDWDNGYSKATDTLHIDVPNGKSFSIERSTRYQQTVNGKQLKPEYKVVHWTGFWDPDTQSILIKSNSRLFTFAKDYTVLYMGSTVYKRITL